MVASLGTQTSFATAVASSNTLAMTNAAPRLQGPVLRPAMLTKVATSCSTSSGTRLVWATDYPHYDGFSRSG
jgi:hypothetical protein